MKDFIRRCLTGLIFVVVLVGAIWWSPFSFAVLFAIITGLALWEYYRLIEKSGRAKIESFSGIVAGIYLFIATFLFQFTSSGLLIFTPYFLYLIYLFVHQLYIKEGDALQCWAYSVFGQFYLAFFFSLLNFICIGIDPVTDEAFYNREYILALFVFIWFYDSGAYLFGVLFGKHRLFERISPKKSWEGAIGGGLLALSSAYVYSFFFTNLSPIEWLGFAAVVVLFGTWGDLSESLMKRNISIKDSGNILPGHGGILDRFDSLLLAIPAVLVYLEVLIRN
ncbi:MAG: phosphatidate cytidylyltransferase [Bacteroidales bacterium]|nr:phosphatidate cytidylyltransferase [Bacteroidales bacterium]